MISLMEKMRIHELSLEDRLLLVQEIVESLGKGNAALRLSEAQRAELERRADEDDANPEDVVPWEQVKADSLARCSK